jgi:hypothetical protein
LPLADADVSRISAIAPDTPLKARLALTSIALVVVAMRSAQAAAAPVAVPLAVEERGGVPRRAFPASASVPFPRGRLARPAALWLAGSDHRPVPMQTAVLERWPDGSVRWLLVDFLADLPAGGRATYTLSEGKPPRAAAGPRIRMDTRDGARTLDTGAITVTIPADGAALASGVVAGGRRLGPIALPTLRIGSEDGERPSPGRVAVETEGTVRTELLLTGRYPRGVAYEARVAVFAGQPFLRLRHTITNLADALYAPVRSLALVVPGSFTSATLGIDGGARPLASLGEPHELRHDDTTPVLLDGRSAGRHADGWAAATGDGLTATLVAPWFWQEYPKAFRVGAERLEVDLMAGSGAAIQFGTGAAKTHEVWVVVEGSDDKSPGGALAETLVAPLVALPAAGWVAASRALPGAVDPAAPDVQDFLARLAKSFAGYQKRVRTERWDDGPPVACQERTAEHPRVGLYGDLNWGDWQFPGYRDRTRGCDGWGNLEYDLPHVLALAWAATGSRDFLATLVPAARHYGDVDVIHHAPGHPEWVGLNHPHKPLHFAFDAQQKVDLGHTWTEGLVSYWRLSGERRALEAARGIADALIPRVAKAHNPRQFGWPMIALAAVHDATGERRYLDGLRAYADAAMAVYRPTPAAGDWKMGILADGLARVDAATGDERLRRWLVSYADALVAEPERWSDARYALPLGYLAGATRSERYAAEARRRVRTLRIGEWGKPLAAMGRTGFRLLAPLPRDLGRSAAPAPAARPAKRPARHPPPALKRGPDAPPPASPRERRPR